MGAGAQYRDRGHALLAAFVAPEPGNVLFDQFTRDLRAGTGGGWPNPNPWPAHLFLHWSTATAPMPTKRSARWAARAGDARRKRSGGE